MNKSRIIFTIIFTVGALLFLGGELLAQTAVSMPAMCLGTQDATYECLDSNNPNGPTYQFQDITGNHPPLTFSNNDDGRVHVTMPFSFTFYDISSDKLTVSMNGAIKFGSHINSINAFNTGLNVAPTYFIAPLWDDLDNSPGIGGGVYTDVIGTAPNRQFIVQWEDIPHYNNTGSSTFQVVFSENGNGLHFAYEDIIFENSNFDGGRSATIGIKGSTSNLQYGYNQQVLTDTIAIHFFPTLNTFPETTGEGYVVQRNGSLTVSAANGLLINDTDPRGTGLTVAVVNDVTHGTLNVHGDGSFAYIPEAGFAGLDLFTYYVNDGTSNSNGEAVYISVQNTAPTAVSDHYTTTQTTPITITVAGVLANDNDTNGDPITAVLDNTVKHGQLTLNSDGSFSYTPDNGFAGDDTFKYHANDGDDDSSIVTVTLTVENIAPTATNDVYTTNAGQLFTVVAPGVLENDVDMGGDPLTAVLHTSTTHGQLQLNSDGSYTYTPDGGFVGEDSFTYYANDGIDNSTSQTVTIEVQLNQIFLPMIIK